ncbi:fimbrillin family protein [Muribaculum intestinale]|uniref:fimbrillin family protein n=1 Tax=Muribaculum intestinale TaxID=1796646 RepID=UPI001C3EE33D|nr:fimbrillin family protein [Muribaculum intestinale]
MNLKLVPFAAMAAIMATSCSKEEVMDINYDPDGKAITFTAGVGHSRAVETTINNLGDFAVYSKVVHPEGVLYDSFLIGADGENGAEIAHKNTSSSNSWELDRKVYLPLSGADVVFWAYTDNTPVTGDVKTPLSSGKVTFDNNKGPQINGYKINKCDLTATDRTIWADGNSQKDLVCAFAQTTKKNVIDLNFNHVLSQISINAIQKDKAGNDSRIVKVKGAWIVNANGTGNLSAGYAYDKDTNTAKENNEWTLSGTESFGSYFSSAIELSSDNASDLLSSSLMLMPQQLNEWNGKDITTNNAYILLLCRVELKHPGATHDGADLSDIGVDGTNHYHQQFPVSTDGKYHAEEYGFSCVPLKSTWSMGKKYSYNLDICGASSGAGVYPPNIPTTTDAVKAYINKLIPSSETEGDNTKIKVVTNRPDGKKVGDPVLEEPIKFNVTVSPWANADSEWKPGNGDF